MNALFILRKRESIYNRENLMLSDNKYMIQKINNKFLIIHIQSRYSQFIGLTHYSYYYKNIPNDIRSTLVFIIMTNKIILYFLIYFKCVYMCVFVKLEFCHIPSA